MKFKTVAGDADRASGILFNVKPNGDWLAVRYNDTENNVALWEFHNGIRRNDEVQRSREASSCSIAAAWHELKLTVDGASFKTWLDGAARARIHARQRAGSRPQRRAAESGPVSRRTTRCCARRSPEGSGCGRRPTAPAISRITSSAPSEERRCCKRVVLVLLSAFADALCGLPRRALARSRRTRRRSSCSSPTRPARSSRTPKVSVTNNQTGAVREATSGARRQRHVPGAVADRHLHGQRVEAGLRRRGAQRHHAARRRNGDAEGEAARRHREGRGHRLRHRPRRARRLADRPCGSTARRSTRRRSSAARSRRCRSSTRRSGRARAPAISSSTPPTSSPARAAAARPRSCSTARATTKAGAARRCWRPCRSARCRKSAVLTNAFSAEFGWTAGPAMNIVTKSGTNALRGEALYLARPGGMAGEDVLDRTASARRRCRPARRPARSTAINPADVPDELNQVSGSIGGPIVKDKTFFFATADYTRAGPHDVPLEHAAGVRAAGRRQPRLRRPLPAGRCSTAGSITS